MPETLLYAIEVTLNGLMAGVLYALVALGFVLIFKASGIFNYAQGRAGAVRGADAGGDPERANPLCPSDQRDVRHQMHHFGWQVPSILAIVLTAW
jgi:branched-chain amino acid transport system permease protein